MVVRVFVTLDFFLSRSVAASYWIASPLSIWVYRVLRRNNLTPFYSGVWLSFYTYYISPIYFERRLHTLEVLQKPYTFVSKQIWNRSFKWDTKHWFWSRGCKDTRGQSWSSEKISAKRPGSNPCAWGQPRWQIFFPNSNFDLWHLWLCRPLNKINV